MIELGVAVAGKRFELGVVVQAKRDGKKKDKQGIEPWPQDVGLGIWARRERRE
jgi:hypothetical protein